MMLKKFKETTIADLKTAMDDPIGKLQVSFDMLAFAIILLSVALVFHATVGHARRN